MHLSKKLLQTAGTWYHQSLLDGTAVKGSYSTTQFVLRLRKDVRDALEASDLPHEKIQASSTSLHENMHWWQHMGSNFGFVFSLAYPAFAHLTRDSLSNLVGKGWAYKSMIRFDRDYVEKHGRADIEDINTILNTYHDIEYAKQFAMDNKNIFEIARDDRFFLNIGHCYNILWVAVLDTLAASVDNEAAIIPDPKKWAGPFRELKNNHASGFSLKTPFAISPIGIRAIFEGQAIFNQVQYLTVGLTRNLRLTDFENAGMLYGVYTEAFELFMHITGYAKPEDPLAPMVGLFLLVCDLAINGNNGFPLDVYDYPEFITKNDPGIRFYKLCEVIAGDPDGYLHRVARYSKEEYIWLSRDLAGRTGCACPYQSIEHVLNWCNQKEFLELLAEEKEFTFSNRNLPIRVLLAKYLRFQKDKWTHPNVFCWFGWHCTPDNGNVPFDRVNEMYKKHHALYTDHDDGEIKPAIFEGKKEENLSRSFNNFYAFHLLYDIIRQWVTEDGPFRFDYKWLSNKSPEEMEKYIRESFQFQFGINLNDVKSLQ